ncbi:hypothetical protein T459_13076 [Capsicum annuum]|uniref:Zinc finger PMZ-type domain-containing protein n=1 Tax=Capsicum annuum TaxID=4072 RepID=A0A2G2ZRN6_CAPAN|nr:hypothetical protein T459_13076 [Capsicum annuum]
MVRSVIESGELECEPKNVVIIYVMNRRGKIHLTFINNDRHVSLYMLDVAVNGSRPLLRRNIVSGSSKISPPQPPIDEHDSFEDESLNVHPMDSEYHSMELKDPFFSEEGGEKCELGAQTNHTFSDETNFQVNQTFSRKKKLKLLLDVATVRNPLDYATLKSCSKFLKVKCVCPSWVWMLQVKKFDAMTTNIVELVNTMLIVERECPVTSIFNSIAKKFGEIFRERRAYILKYKDNKFVSIAEKILRDNMSKGDSFYVENVSGDERQFTVFGSGCTTKVDLLERSYACRKFNLVKISCDQAMTTLRWKHGEDYGLRVYDYSSPMYKVEEYLLAYSESINVVPLEFE